MNPPTNSEQTLDDLLLTFAKRIESTPRGKTYDWSREKAALSTMLVEILNDNMPAGVDETCARLVASKQRQRAREKGFTL